MIRFSGQRIDPLSLAFSKTAPRGELKDLYFFIYNDGKLKVASVKIPTNLKVIAEPFSSPLRGDVSGADRGGQNINRQHTFKLFFLLKK